MDSGPHGRAPVLVSIDSPPAACVLAVGPRRRKRGCPRPGRQPEAVWPVRRRTPDCGGKASPPAKCI